MNLGKTMHIYTFIVAGNEIYLYVGAGYEPTGTACRVQ